MKLCKTCGTEKPEDDYYKRSGGVCKICWSARCRDYNDRNKDKLAKYRRAYAAKNKEKLAELNHKSSMKRKYGITPAQRDAMFVQQGGKCRICQRTGRLVVDHCHRTGTVRMLLCDSCNRGLGCFRDDPALLLRAAEVIGAYMEAAA